jgi:hypothetical protein
VILKAMSAVTINAVAAACNVQVWVKPAEIRKSFLVLFFKKERLAFS